MLEKLLRVMRALRAVEGLMSTPPSAGEVGKWGKISKSTTKRFLERAERFGLVHSEMIDYKTTGKRVYYMLAEGSEFIESQLEMPL